VTVRSLRIVVREGKAELKPLAVDRNSVAGGFSFDFGCATVIEKEKRLQHPPDVKASALIRRRTWLLSQDTRKNDVISCKLIPKVLVLDITFQLEGKNQRLNVRPVAGRTQPFIFFSNRTAKI
jgi:hypothetical protein